MVRHAGVQSGGKGQHFRGQVHRGNVEVGSQVGQGMAAAGTQLKYRIPTRPESFSQGLPPVLGIIYILLRWAEQRPQVG